MYYFGIAMPKSQKGEIVIVGNDFSPPLKL